MKKELHLIIKGRVQGVFYRDSAKKKADELEIKGYVRNLSNGDVEAVVRGDENKLKIFIEWCWQGSTASKVEDIILEEKKSKEKYSGFEVRF